MTATPKKTWQIRETTTTRAKRLAERFGRSQSDVAEAALLLAETLAELWPDVISAAMAAVPQLQPTKGTGRRAVADKLRELRAQRAAAGATDSFEEHRATYEDMSEEELFARPSLARGKGSD